MSGVEPEVVGIVDDAVREVHGCRARDKKGNWSRIIVCETDSLIVLDGSFGDAFMTQWQARYLAAKLYRLARRLRARDFSRAHPVSPLSVSGRRDEEGSNHDA